MCEVLPHNGTDILGVGEVEHVSPPAPVDDSLTPSPAPPTGAHSFQGWTLADPAKVVGLDGTHLALWREADRHQQRAEAAEEKLSRIRRLCRAGKHFVKLDGRYESVNDAVIRILDEDT